MFVFNVIMTAYWNRSYNNQHLIDMQVKLLLNVKHVFKVWINKTFISDKISNIYRKMLDFVVMWNIYQLYCFKCPVLGRN